LLRGRPGDPAWARPALIGILLLTGVLYAWALDRAGYGNTYYAPTAASGGTSWTA